VHILGINSDVAGVQLITKKKYWISVSFRVHEVSDTEKGNQCNNAYYGIYWHACLWGLWTPGLADLIGLTGLISRWNSWRIWPWWFSSRTAGGRSACLLFKWWSASNKILLFFHQSDPFNHFKAPIFQPLPQRVYDLITLAL